MLNWRMPQPVPSHGFKSEDKMGGMKMKHKRKIRNRKTGEQLTKDAILKAETFWEDKLLKIQGELLQSVSTAIKNVFLDYKER